VLVDGDAAYVFFRPMITNEPERVDLYEMEDPQPRQDRITRVVVHIHSRAELGLAGTQAGTQMRAGAPQIFNGPFHDLGTTYTDITQVYEVHPVTEQPWTWAQVNQVQAGVRQRVRSTADAARTTTVWLEVCWD
jgi:hypothetical protein